MNRLKVATLAVALGGHRLPGVRHADILVLNYHRLRPTAPQWSTSFNDAVFDTDAETFRRQMEWLSRETEVLDEEGLARVTSDGSAPRKTSGVYSAVTFDDGYIECATVVRPVLDKLGVRGIFFIPFEMIDLRRLGWWDLAVNLLKKTSRRHLSVDGQSYDLGRDFSGSLRTIVRRFKLEPADQTSHLLEKLAVACDVPLASPSEQSAELMTWADVRALHSAGHAIGAHSVTHRVLATLDVESQAREIRESGRRLEEILGSRVRSFAYPVGGPEHINADSVRLVREAGYEQAFTFNTGVATLPLADRFQVPRESARSLEVLKAKALLPGLMRLRRGPAVPGGVST